MFPPISSPRSRPCRSLIAAAGLVLFLLPVAALLAGEIGLPEVQVNGPAYLVPAGAARWVYPGAPDAPPPVAAFWEANGPGWRIFWDPVLESARFVFPLDHWPVAPPGALEPGADPGALIEAAAAFIDLAAGLLGVGSQDLTGASTYATGTSPVVVFGQASAGLRVSGAEVRIVFDQRGRPGWMRARTLRHCPAVDGPFLDEGDITRRVESWGGGTVRSASLELGFPGEDPGVAVPIYRVHATDAEDRSSEWIVDARNGEVLVRRRDLRFADGVPAGGAAEFPVEGIVRARLMDEESGRLLSRPVRAVLVEDNRERLLGLSGAGGFFAFVVGENPAELRASLQTGKCRSRGMHTCFPVPRDLAATAYIPTLVVRPQHFGDGGVNPLPPQDDINADGIPDHSVFGDIDRLFDLHFNGHVSMDRVEELLNRTWWVTIFEAGVGALAYLDRLAGSFDLERPPFSPLTCVELRPEPATVPISAYQPPRFRGSCGIVMTSRRIDHARDPGVVERTPVSIFLHEMGHHVFAGLTGLGAAGTTGIEEGFADAFAGMVTGTCRVGYLADGTPTSRAFCLGASGDDYRDARRKAAGNAFWALHRRLPRQGNPDGAVDPLPGEETVGAGLIVAWLAFDRVPDGAPRGFGNDNDLLEQLLLVDDTAAFGGDNRLLNGTPHQDVILDIFRGTPFFEAPFVRGDTTPDFRFDITDGINIFNALFLGRSERDCRNSFDADDSGRIEVTDGIILLNYLFLGGKPLPPPFPACGLDPQPPGEPGNLGCYDYVCPR